MIRRHGVTLISIGNGTASYETEQFVSQLIENYKLNCRYVITNEAGASVYSASELAREELPDLDVTIRGAVSIARRIQDPLAESVKSIPAPSASASISTTSTKRTCRRPSIRPSRRSSTTSASI